MNVYVRELVSALAHAGIDCTTYTRTWNNDLPQEILVEPNHRVVHIPAGPVDIPKEHLIDVVPEFTDGVLRHINAHGGTDLIHANYWLSGLSGHALKHEHRLQRENRQSEKRTLVNKVEYPIEADSEERVYKW